MVHLTEKRVKIAEKDDAKMVARVVAVESNVECRMLSMKRSVFAERAAAVESQIGEFSIEY